MKILLFALNSSFVHTNLAVRSIADALKDSDCSVQILERNLKDRRDGVLRELYDANADIYGFSAYIWNITELLKYASSLKQLRPDSTVVFGGPEVSFEDDSFFEKHPYVDKLIHGEGENAWIDLINGKAGGKIIEGRSYDGFLTQKSLYRALEPGGKIAYYESSRGCPYKCSFCLSSLTDGVRAKSVSDTLSDLRDFQKYHGDVKIIKFVDRTFNFDRDRAYQIWKALLDDEFTLSYHFEICASLLREDDFELLKQFPKGKIQLEIGVQSTNPVTLKAISRIDDSASVISAAKRIHSFGNIHVHCDLIAGLPYESYQSFKKSFNDVYESCDMLQLGFLKLLRGSALRNDADKYGILYEEDPPYSVLKTNAITYEEVSTLHDISSLLERFTEGAFSNTFKYINATIDSPFDFFEGLANYLKKISPHSSIASHSQNSARELLLSYCYSHPDLDNDVVSSLMALDFYLTDITSIPAFLQKYVFEDDECKEVLRERFNGKWPSSTIARRFAFDRDAIYIINRKNHNYIKVYR